MNVLCIFPIPMGESEACSLFCDAHPAQHIEAALLVVVTGLNQLGAVDRFAYVVGGSAE